MVSSGVNECNRDLSTATARADSTEHLVELSLGSFRTVDFYCPIPLKATRCGLPIELVLIDRVPVSSPDILGVKVIEIVQELDRLSVAPQVLV